MSKHHSFFDTIDQVATTAINKGIAHLYTQDTELKSNSISLKGKDVINFGSCSYLGLEFDKRMISASQEAVGNYGTTFAESRAYVSIKHYQVLEDLFYKIFNYPAIVAPTTTLGHIAALPVLISDDDAIIVDHQVHFSVQTAVNLVKSRGIHVEMIRHNRMDLLEDRIKLLRKKYQRIWYMADGIYSMYGDASPVNDVYALMEKYPELYYYVDDAHGMSVFGKNGSGYVLSQKPMHHKMVMATSLAKGFATGGAVLVFPNKELCSKVRKCGSSFITSGPMQPSQLGAAIASANIHLSNEIYSLQEDLHENIKFANLMLKKYGLPVVAETDSPVFFVGVGLPKLGYNMVKRMLDEGYYVNIGIFPAVPIKNTGIRFTITRLHTFKQIESMIAAMADHFPKALAEEGMTMEQIYQAFKMKTPAENQIKEAFTSEVNQLKLKIEHHSSITQVDPAEWNSLLGERGTFDWEGLKFLEDSFRKNELPENNWDFDYLIIKDKNNQPVLATFLTAALCKDDMLSPSAVSEQVEHIRKADNPYYLTSKVLSLGSMLTEGEHLFLDRTSPYWKDAMAILFEKITELQEKYKANTIMLRDFDTMDNEMDAFLIENGFFKIGMPDNHSAEIKWNNQEEFLSSISPRSKRHVKQDILRHEDKFETEIVSNPSVADIQHYHQLYRNVQGHSLTLNTFPLPYTLFEQMILHKNWDIITLKIKPELDSRKERKPVAAMFSYATNKNYNFMVVGIDYDYLEKFKCYKQALYQVIKRAKQLKLENVRMGFTTTTEKKKLGAKIIPTAAYMQTKDNYSMQVLGNISIIEKNKTLTA